MVDCVWLRGSGELPRVTRMPVVLFYEDVTVRKISRNYLLQSINCRVKFAARILLLVTVVSSPDQTFAQSILAPEPPAAAPPPVIPPERDPALLRKQEINARRDAETKKETETKEKIQETKKEDKAKAEAKKPRPLYGFAELSLLQPKAIVSKGRSTYVSDLTTHMNSYVRLFWNNGAEDPQPWLGFRAAPFGGYGTQDKLTARFAHTWMGPAIGFGRIAKASDPSEDYPVRHGFLFSAGIDGVSRLIADDESAEPLPDDFKPTPWAFDSPGAWAELRWIRVSMGAFGLGAMAGAQTGTGKMFVYAGATVSGFY